jgi:glycosyltransferase involved in cell wall biosynthesis
MKKILLLVPNLDFTHIGRQVSLLLPGLPRDTFAVQVSSMRGAGPFATPLRQAGIPVYGQRGERFFDFEDWIGLRQRVSDFQPDVIHVFGYGLLKVLRLACLGKSRAFRAVLTPGSELQIRPGWWTRRLLRGISAVTASDEWERNELSKLNLDPASVKMLPATFGRESGVNREVPIAIPENAKLILAPSNFESPEAARDAVWAFDILRYIDPSLHLLVVGDGPARASVEGFARSIGRDDFRVHFLAESAGFSDLLKRSSFLWLTDRRPSGTSSAIEAMARGVPVVASDLPNYRCLQQNPATLTLIPVGSPPDLARAMRPLLKNPELPLEQAERARLRVEAKHSPEATVNALSAIYRSL